MLGQETIYTIASGTQGGPRLPPARFGVIKLRRSCGLLALRVGIGADPLATPGAPAISHIFEALAAYRYKVFLSRVRGSRVLAAALK